MNDKVSNLIIKIKNANLAGKEMTVVPFSNFFMNILSVLKENNFISSFVKRGKKVIKNIEITLSYKEGRKPAINGVKRKSSSSKRVYLKSGEIKKVKHGYGILVISTSKGVMSGENARKEKLGGEPLFEIF